MFFFQLPYHLPITKQSAKGKEKAEGSQGASLKNMSSLKELPPGLVGKMRIYKSGKIDMKLGDTVFDVSTLRTFLNKDKYKHIKCTHFHLHIHIDTLLLDITFKDE